MSVNKKPNLTREEHLLRLIAAQRLESTRAAATKREVHKGLEWSKLIDYVLYEGLASLLYRHLQTLRLFYLTPKWFEETLENFYNKTLYHNLQIIQFLDDLGQILKEDKLPLIVLQGAALLLSVYNDLGVRPMEDIDLMVMPSRKKDLCGILREMGFSSDPVYPDTYQRGAIYIDIHSDILSSERIHARKWVMLLDLENVWNSALPLIDESVPLYRLSTYDNLIALSNHLLKHNYAHLKWFVDIQEVILEEHGKFDWRSFASHCKRSRSDRFVLYVLLLARGILGLNVPDSALTAFGNEKLSSVERVVLRLRLGNKDVGRLFQLLWLFQIKQMREKFHFMIESVFPRKEIMNQIFFSVCRSRPSSYVLRLLNILFHGLYDSLMAIRDIIFGKLPKL